MAGEQEQLIHRGQPLTQEDADDITEALIEKMRDILHRTANALKGEPEPLHLHGWHDLPELAKAAKEAALNATAQADAEEQFDSIEERLNTARWNLGQCDHDCNDWARAQSRITEALEIIEAYRTSRATGASAPPTITEGRDPGWLSE